MPKYIQVGADVIEFPDDMTDEQIAQALSPRATATPPSSSFLMGLKDPISGAAQLLPRALASATSLGGAFPNPVSRFLSEEARRVDEMVRAEEAAFQAQRAQAGETGFDVARTAGNILSPAGLVPATRAAQLARAAGAGKVAQASAAGVAGALTQPVVGEGEFAPQKTEQAVIGAVTGPIGEKVVSGAGRVLNPLVSKAEQTMRDLGIQPTTGQTLGGAFKSFEDFAQNLPLVGRSIQNARQRTLFDFNKSVINSALKKVNEKLPADVIGRDAIAFASDTVGQKYDEVLAKMSFDLDFATTSKILAELAKFKNLSPDQRNVIASEVNETVLGKFSGQKLSGAEYKGIESDLRKKAANYANSATASEREIGDALTRVLGVFKQELHFQNPKQTSQLRRIDSAYGDLAVINVAAANSSAQSGVFTPKNFSVAVRQKDQTRNKSAFAKGRARSQEISDAALEVLGDSAASTQEGRTAIFIGGGYGLLANPYVGVPAAVLAPPMYSPGGQRLMDVLLRSRPEAMQRAGGLLSGASAEIGGVTVPSAIGQYNLSERRQ